MLLTQARRLFPLILEPLLPNERETCEADNTKLTAHRSLYCTVPMRPSARPNYVAECREHYYKNACSKCMLTIPIVMPI